MDDDLFTCEVKIANIPCDSKMDNDSKDEVDDDMGYDSSDIRGDDEVELTDEESSNDKDEVAKMRSHGLTLEFGLNPHQLNILASLSTIKLDVRNGQHVVGWLMDTVMEETYPELTLLETNYIIWITSDDDESRYEQMRRWNINTNYDDAYETNHGDNKIEKLCEVHELPMCNIRRYVMIKYSFNNDEKYVAVKEDEYDDLTITRAEACQAYQEIFRIIPTPTCSWIDDGYCNGGNLPGTYIIRNQLHYQDYEGYEGLEDSELKDEVLRNKAIMEGFINEGGDESRYEQERRWNIYTNYDDAYEINHENNKKEELCEVHELPMCNIRRYMMIKYSFNNDEEYVAVKEDKYDDPTITREEACQAYQEIFWIMDEGW
ncbi:hypothetical protein Tco_0424069 [Tanacetum coccineum]